MANTVILGGGVIGAATAYYLSLRGVHATVVERRSIASGASGTAAGLLSAPAPSDLRQPWGELARASLPMHYEVAEVLNGPANYDFEPVDTALIARDEAERAHLVAEFGEDAWLDPAELAARCPWLEGSGPGGVLRAGGAQLDPARFTETLLEAADADVTPDSAEGLMLADGRVQGVRLGAVVLPAEQVVVAMGPWSVEAGPWLGMPVPVTPLKGQILRMEVPGAPPGGFADLDGNYLVRKPTGMTYTGTTEEEAGFDESPTPDAEQRILANAHRLAPLTKGGNVVLPTACLRPLSADNVPIIGKAPGAEGVYIATGHGRKGIMLSLATGKALAELMLDGESRSIDLAPFAPSRFAGSEIFPKKD